MGLPFLRSMLGRGSVASAFDGGSQGGITWYLSFPGLSPATGTIVGSMEDLGAFLAWGLSVESGRSSIMSAQSSSDRSLTSTVFGFLFATTLGWRGEMIERISYMIWLWTSYRVARFSRPSGPNLFRVLKFSGAGSKLDLPWLMWYS